MRGISPLTLFVVFGFAGLPTAMADVFNMPAGQTSIQMVNVGDVGNAADSNGLGRVTHDYSIDKYHVTVAQYCEFLNAVAKTDPYGLWNTNMGSPFAMSYFGQIDRSGSLGNYTYTMRSGHDNRAVNDVNWGSAARFANWLSNGQPATGVEDATTTERGSYNLDGAITNSALANVSRNPIAAFVIPSQDEWYKAAYYKGGGINSGYWDYGTQNDTMPSNVLDVHGLNNAVYWTTGFTDAAKIVPDVGTFVLCTSAYGAYDMGGLMWQWSETGNISRHAMGGTYGWYGNYQNSGFLMAAPNQNFMSFNSSYSDGSTGFRIAAVPEPAAMGILALGSLILLVHRRTRHAR